ncbi:hypothetical protein E1295_31795 [Nonomuraea mesophila]|uniref:Holin n=1 Tax=Nonomuraea mesophila TaxID=2530382 RepID=A0A4R5EZF8_9ACTN|nr:hypothetical protein [Nonomuraea mesophila]TDE40484.1 hypothetical protein E1295_31795 [Nonomuraea mesophila]
MHDLIRSWIRTAVPAGVGGLAAWLGTKGLDVDPADALAVGAGVASAATVVYQAIVSTLQRRWPVVGVLLGSTKSPTYTTQPERYHPGTHAGNDLYGL